MKPKYWWIKERDNPQLGVYYVAMGKLPIKQARAMEHAAYGSNMMHRFSSEASYFERVNQLRAEGKRVQ